MQVNAKIKTPDIPEYAWLLKRAREQKKWKQTHVAKQIGVSPMMLSFMERGVRDVKLSVLEKWLALFDLGLKVDFLKNLNN